MYEFLPLWPRKFARLKALNDQQNSKNGYVNPHHPKNGGWPFTRMKHYDEAKQYGNDTAKYSAQT